MGGTLLRKVTNLFFFYSSHFDLNLFLFQSQAWPILLSGRDLIGIAQVRLDWAAFVDIC